MPLNHTVDYGREGLHEDRAHAPLAMAAEMSLIGGRESPNYHLRTDDIPGAQPNVNRHLKRVAHIRT